MKRFEFRLSRVLDLRRQQADVEQSRLQSLLVQVRRIDDEKKSLESQATDAREQVSRSTSVLGEELSALCGFERHIRNRTAQLDQERNETQLRVQQQQTIVMEAERKVSLLLKLRQRKLTDWTCLEQKELETLAAESYLSRIGAARRIKDSVQTDTRAIIRR
jgi:flagellar export protein FliJ